MQAKPLLDFVSALTVFTLMVGSTGVGVLVRSRLPEAHRGRETLEMMTLVISMLVTFAALVISLVTASVKEAYDAAAHDRALYALQLTQLDQCLRDYGSPADPARRDIRSYTAAVIASTWPHETPPSGVSYPDVTGMPLVGSTPVLTDLIQRAGVEIERLTPADGYQQRKQAICDEDYRDMLAARRGILEDVQKRLSAPFYRVLVFWLMVIFACFGLVAPRNPLALVTIALCALSLSSAIYVVDDLSQPYGGLFSIPSDTMRDALESMMRPGG